MKKWTDYYGDVREVEIDQDKEGRYIGYHFGCVGENFYHLRKTLPKNQYWDTEEEARAGVLRNLKREERNLVEVVDWLLLQVINGCLDESHGKTPPVVKKWVRKTVKDIEADSLLDVRSRIRWMEKRK